VTAARITLRANAVRVVPIYARRESDAAISLTTTLMTITRLVDTASVDTLGLDEGQHRPDNGVLVPWKPHRVVCLVIVVHRTDARPVALLSCTRTSVREVPQRYCCVAYSSRSPVGIGPS